VFVNDELVGSHEVGFTPFTFDVSGRLRPGPNTIRVEVTDPGHGHDDFMRTPQGKQGWGNDPFPSPPSVYITYGGIWQGCRLVTHGGAYVSDAWCDMDPDRPLVSFSTTGEPDDIRIAGLEGDLGLWSPSDPVLHRVTVEAIVDGRVAHTRSFRTGLRKIERNGDDVLINGEIYRMRSALHQGFWPDGLYAADPGLIERDIDLASDAGLNTLRTHLKAFEPSWMDAADRKGMLLQCDLPISEPLRDETLLSDETFIRRCVIAATEQVRRDRSRPSILFWTLLNEVGLFNIGMLETDAYRALVATLRAAVEELDTTRPIVENDWVLKRKHLVNSDVRTAHWYGRTTDAFMRELDDRLIETGAESGPFYVSEFGEWGLPSRESGSAFWSQDDELGKLVTASGWRGTYDDFVDATQDAQGWADRLQAERFRTAAHVHGFCLTEWTDVPHELNGLVSLRRNGKRAIDGFRPALADVAPIAVLRRYVYGSGEVVCPRIFISNWSSQSLDAGEVTVVLGRNRVHLPVPEIAAGTVVAVQGDVALPARPGPLTLAYRDVSSAYAIHVTDPGAAIDSVSVGIGTAPDERPAVVIDPTSLPDGWPELDEVPTSWGPTPVPFTTSGLRCLPDNHVLSHEVFACYPKTVIPNVHGALNLFVAPPIGKWGALIAKRDGLVVCTLSIADALERKEGFALALLADLKRLAAES
jgi:hypothetical protein